MEFELDIELICKINWEIFGKFKSVTKTRDSYYNSLIRLLVSGQLFPCLRRQRRLSNCLRLRSSLVIDVRGWQNSPWLTSSLRIKSYNLRRQSSSRHLEFCIFSKPWLSCSNGSWDLWEMMRGLQKAFSSFDNNNSGTIKSKSLGNVLRWQLENH